MGVAQPEATGPHIAEEDTWPEATGSHVVEEATQPEAGGSLSHLAAAKLLLNETFLPNTQQQVGFIAPKLLPSIIIYNFFGVC